MAKRQIVIYHRPTGVILKTLHGGTISTRKQLSNHAPTFPLAELGFYYEEDSVTINIISDRVRALSPGQPPSLCDPSGLPKAYYSHIETMANYLENKPSLTVNLEGGMGDQIMQLEALKALHKQKPQLKTRAGIHTNYINILPYLEHYCDYIPNQPTNPLAHTTAFVSMATEFISDPRGGIYGKASLYGAHLGLQEVHETVSLRFPPGHAAAWIRKAGISPENIVRPLLGIHIRSGSGGAKSWNTQPAQVLAALWHTQTGGGIYLCGDPANFTNSSPFTLTLPNRCDWASVAALIQSLDLLVCIDSGPMHLARSAAIPHIILWGGTSPADILGRPPGPTDLIHPTPCHRQICYSCPQGNPLCIRSITPLQVLDIAYKIVPSLFSPPYVPIGGPKEITPNVTPQAELRL